MRDEISYLVFAAIIGIAMCLAAIVAYWGGYKTGQVDYANGRIGVVLEKQSDGSSVWKMK